MVLYLFQEAGLPTQVLCLAPVNSFACFAELELGVPGEVSD